MGATTLDNLSALYCARESLSKDFNSFLASTLPIYLVEGDRGSGKSFQMAWWSRDLPAVNPDAMCFLFSEKQLAADSLLGNMRTALEKEDARFRELLQEVLRRKDLDFLSAAGWGHIWEKLYVLFPGRHLYFFVDAPTYRLEALVKEIWEALRAVEEVGAHGLVRHKWVIATPLGAGERSSHPLFLRSWQYGKGKTHTSGGPVTLPSVFRVHRKIREILESDCSVTLSSRLTAGEDSAGKKALAQFYGLLQDFFHIPVFAVRPGKSYDLMELPLDLVPAGDGKTVAALVKSLKENTASLLRVRILVEAMKMPGKDLEIAWLDKLCGEIRENIRKIQQAVAMPVLTDLLPLLCEQKEHRHSFQQQVHIITPAGESTSNIADFRLPVSLSCDHHLLVKLIFRIVDSRSAPSLEDELAIEIKQKSSEQIALSVIRRTENADKLVKAMQKESGKFDRTALYLKEHFSIEFYAHLLAPDRMAYTFELPTSAFLDDAKRENAFQLVEERLCLKETGDIEPLDHFTGNELVHLLQTYDRFYWNGKYRKEQLEDFVRTQGEHELAMLGIPEILAQRMAILNRHGLDYLRLLASRDFDYLISLLQFYQPRNNQSSFFKKVLEHTDSNLLITGAEGTGKSAFMAAMYCASECPAYFIENSGPDVSQFLCSIYDQLFPGKTLDPTLPAAEMMSTLVKELDRQGHVRCVLVDGLESACRDGDFKGSIVMAISRLSKATDCIRFVATSSPNDEIRHQLKFSAQELSEVCPLARESMEQFFVQKLAAYSGCSLEDAQKLIPATRLKGTVAGVGHRPWLLDLYARELAGYSAGRNFDAPLAEDLEDKFYQVFVKRNLARNYPVPVELREDEALRKEVKELVLALAMVGEPLTGCEVDNFLDVRGWDGTSEEVLRWLWPVLDLSLFHQGKYRLDHHFARYLSRRLTPEVVRAGVRLVCDWLEKSYGGRSEVHPYYARHYHKHLQQLYRLELPRQKGAVVEKLLALATGSLKALEVSGYIPASEVVETVLEAAEAAIEEDRPATLAGATLLAVKRHLSQSRGLRRTESGEKEPLVFLRQLLKNYPRDAHRAIVLYALATFVNTAEEQRQIPAICPETVEKLKYLATERPELDHLFFHPLLRPGLKQLGIEIKKSEHSRMKSKEYLPMVTDPKIVHRWMTKQTSFTPKDWQPVYERISELWGDRTARGEMLWMGMARLRTSDVRYLQGLLHDAVLVFANEESLKFVREHPYHLFLPITFATLLRQNRKFAAGEDSAMLNRILTVLRRREYEEIWHAPVYLAFLQNADRDVAMTHRFKELLERHAKDPAQAFFATQALALEIDILDDLKNTKAPASENFFNAQSKLLYIARLISERRMYEAEEHLKLYCFSDEMLEWGQKVRKIDYLRSIRATFQENLQDKERDAFVELVKNFLAARQKQETRFVQESKDKITHFIKEHIAGMAKEENWREWCAQSLTDVYLKIKDHLQTPPVPEPIWRHEIFQQPQVNRIFQWVLRQFLMGYEAGDIVETEERQESEPPDPGFSGPDAFFRCLEQRGIELPISTAFKDWLVYVAGSFLGNPGLNYREIHEEVMSRGAWEPAPAKCTITAQNLEFEAAMNLVATLSWLARVAQHRNVIARLLPKAVWDQNTYDWVLGDFLAMLEGEEFSESRQTILDIAESDWPERLR